MRNTTHASPPSARRKMAVLIPARNEAATIGQIVSQVSSQGVPVVVVDDGSTDSTADIAKSSGAEVLRNQKALGLGGALQRGLANIFSRGFSIAVSIDGDGAHDPMQIPATVRHHIRTKADLTIGSRLIDRILPPSFPSAKEAANRFAAFLLKRVAGTDLRDVASGMRVIGRRVLELPTLSVGYGYSFELICAAIAKGLVVQEYPIRVRYDARELLATRRVELTALLQTAAKYARHPRYVHTIKSIQTRVQSWKMASVRISDVTFVLYPLKQYEAYLVQEQLAFFVDTITTKDVIQL
jgi:UDP-N-acetylglucosamine---dolichyl-phosphate N-acetylglucosaminyltransferase